ncbi:MAG: GntR family transcriptional regulator [Leucobacter sp.]
MFDDTRPIFLQLADRIADDILRGIYAEDTQVPSTNELAAFMRINPATAGKALNLLVDKEVLFKRRGIGMFVSPGAKALISGDRKQGFVDGFIAPLLTEAKALGLETEEVLRLVESESHRESAGTPTMAGGDTVP